MSNERNMEMKTWGSSVISSPTIGELPDWTYCEVWREFLFITLEKWTVGPSTKTVTFSVAGDPAEPFYLKCVCWFSEMVTPHVRDQNLIPWWNLITLRILWYKKMVKIASWWWWVLWKVPSYHWLSFHWHCERNWAVTSKMSC